MIVDNRNIFMDKPGADSLSLSGIRTIYAGTAGQVFAVDLQGDWMIYGKQGFDIQGANVEPAWASDQAVIDAAVAGGGV